VGEPTVQLVLDAFQQPLSYDFREGTYVIIKCVCTWRNDFKDKMADIINWKFQPFTTLNYLVLIYNLYNDKLGDVRE